MDDKDRESIIEYCKNNRTSQRDLMNIFGFKHRIAVKKFLEENDIEINPYTEEERIEKIRKAKHDYNIKSWEAIEIEKVITYCMHNKTSERELVELFNFSSRASLRSFLKYYNISIKQYDQSEVNEKISSTYSNMSDDRLDEIKEKRKNTMISKYGVEHPFHLVDIKNKMKESNIKKYGAENPFQCEKFKEKIKNTMNERYKVNYPSQSKEIKEKMMKTLIDNNYMSKGEKDLNEWVKSLGFETKKHFIKEYTKTNKYKSSYEIDIFIPSKNIGIEFNGEYWHSDKAIHDKNYHYKKSLVAEKQGIRIIHVLETYWGNSDKRVIYETIIRNALGAPVTKIRAHNCEIKEITTQEAKEFFNTNHLGGYVPSKLSYGLFYKGELVQAELFGGSRFNKNIEWESIRGCSKLGYMVYGGYEKVLKHFIKEYDPKTIISYVDFNIFSGKLHEHAGFRFKKYTGPDHWYLDEGGKLKRYWIVRGNKKSDIDWAKKRDESIKFHYWFAGSKVYVWEKNKK